MTTYTLLIIHISQKLSSQEFKALIFIMGDVEMRRESGTYQHNDRHPK